MAYEPVGSRRPAGSHQLAGPGPAAAPRIPLLMAIAVQVPLGQGPGSIPVQATIDEIAAALRQGVGDALGRSVVVGVAPFVVDGVARATNFGVFDRAARPGEDRIEAIAALDLLRERPRSAQTWNLAALLAERLLEQGLRTVEIEALDSMPAGAAASVAAEVAFEAVDDHLVTQLVLRRRRRNGQLGRALLLEWDEQAVPSNQPFVPCQPLSRVFVEIHRNRAGAADGLPDTSLVPGHGALGALALRGAFPTRIPVLLAEPTAATDPAARPGASRRPAALDLFYLTFSLDEEGPLAGLVAQLEGREVPRRPCVRIEAPAGLTLGPATEPTEATEVMEVTLRAVGADLRAPLQYRWQVAASDAAVTVLQPTAAETVLRLEPRAAGGHDAAYGHGTLSVEVAVDVVDADGAAVGATRTITVERPVIAAR